MKCDTTIVIGDLSDMKDGQRQTASGAELLEAGETALRRGNSRQAFDLLARASKVGVAIEDLGRLAAAFATAGRFQGRQEDVRDWLEEVVAGDSDPAHRVALYGARIMMWRHLDITRVEGLMDEALLAAEHAGNDDAYAVILSHGAFAAYRRNDLRAANRYAAKAGARNFETRRAQYAAVRTQLFAAVIPGDLEHAIHLSTKAKAIARELGDIAGIANECNNLAEFYLDLGCPHEAKLNAGEAVRLAQECGHSGLEYFGRSLGANAMAQLGSIDEALEAYAGLRATDRIFAADIATVYSFWLLERRAAGDARHAREVTQKAISHAENTGIDNRLTPLYGNLARALICEGDDEGARSALENARVAAEHSELPAQLLLALAVAEVMPASNPKRHVVLNQARGRILRTAERREDPAAYCLHVRLNRRLLELSGGIPDDLPGSP